jgi:hypothetical protein
MNPAPAVTTCCSNYRLHTNQQTQYQAANAGKPRYIIIFNRQLTTTIIIKSIACSIIDNVKHNDNVLLIMHTQLLEKQVSLAKLITF